MSILYLIYKSCFHCRYGDCHPVFYIGSLDDAIKDSLLVKAKEVSHCQFICELLNCILEPLLKKKVQNDERTG